MHSDLEKEKIERLKAQHSFQERIAALERVNSFLKPQNSSVFQGREYRKDLCMCVIGGYGILAHEQAI